MCSTQYTYIVPYAYGTSRTCMGRMPIPYTYRQLSHMHMRNSLLYRIETTLRGFHAQCSSIRIAINLYIWIAYMPCTHECVQPECLNHTYTLQLIIAIQLSPYTYQMSHAYLYIGYRHRKLSTTGVQRVIKKHLYGEKLHFYGVIVKPGGTCPLSPCMVPSPTGHPICVMGCPIYKSQCALLHA